MLAFVFTFSKKSNDDTLSSREIALYRDEVVRRTMAGNVNREREAFADYFQKPLETDKAAAFAEDIYGALLHASYKDNNKAEDLAFAPLSSKGRQFYKDLCDAAGSKAANNAIVSFLKGCGVKALKEDTQVMPDLYVDSRDAQNDDYEALLYKGIVLAVTHAGAEKLEKNEKICASPVWPETGRTGLKVRP